MILFVFSCFFLPAAGDFFYFLEKTLNKHWSLLDFWRRRRQKILGFGIQNLLKILLFFLLRCLLFRPNPVGRETNYQLREA